MSPELIIAIKDRLHAGQTKEEIQTAVLAMGHSQEVFNAAFVLAEHDVEKSRRGALPGIVALFKNGWNFATTRFDLIVLLSIPLIIEVLASFWFGYDELTDEFPPLPLFGIFVLLGITYVVTLAMTLFTVTRQAEELTDLKSAFHWTIKNAFPLLLVYLLSGLVILGGFLFFLIPGFVVLVTITFAQYAYVREGSRGMAALLSSRSVVAGRWFTVALKIFGFILLSFVPMLLFGMVYGIVEGIAGESAVTTLGGELLTQMLSAVLSIINIHAMYHLYLALREGKEGVVASTFTKARYIAMAALSILVLGVLAVLAMFYRESLDWLEEAAEPLEAPTEVQTAVPASFSLLNEAALRYTNEKNGSFSGVCEVLRPVVTEGGEVTCNDSETAWALEYVDADGGRFCADTATPGKEIGTQLAGKTECIQVPAAN